jgi:uncharacterized protein (DUF433 family)
MKSTGWFRQRNETIVTMRRAGVPVKVIAERYGLSLWRVYTIAKEYNAKPR